METQTTQQLFWLQTYLTLLSSLGSESQDRWDICGYFSDSKLVSTSGCCRIDPTCEPELYFLFFFFKGELDPTSATCDENMKKRYKLFKGGQEVNFYAPLLTSGLSQQSKVLPALTKGQSCVRACWCVRPIREG